MIKIENYEQALNALDQLAGTMYTVQYAVYMAQHDDDMPDDISESLLCAAQHGVDLLKELTGAIAEFYGDDVPSYHVDCVKWAEENICPQTGKRLSEIHQHPKLYVVH